MVFNDYEDGLQMVSQEFFQSQSPKHENTIEILTMSNHIFQNFYMIIYFIPFGHHLKS